MSAGMLEHVNVTVSDPDRTARMLCELFGWHVRWQGPSKMGGHTVHVGTEDGYLAVYTHPRSGKGDSIGPGLRWGGLNHVGVLVDDLDAVERRIHAAGIETFNHGDYEPGRRFYFNDPDGIEFEVVSYAS
ncbi:MAG: VOC family protein [Pseudomonadales bacterium]